MRELNYVANAPLAYRCATWLVRRKVRGSTFLFNNLARAGMFDCVAQFPFTDELPIVAPLFTDNLWDVATLRSYEQDYLKAMVRATRNLPRPLRLIDCGASFGLFSMRMATVCPNLDGIVAFEPNHELFPILERNLRQLKMSAAAHHAAVSDWQGHGELRAPEGDTSPDARYLVESPTGNVSVMRLDDLEIFSNGGLIVKIDVEGQEINVIQGGLRQLCGVEQFVVGFEAHPQVMKRTGLEPMECIRELNRAKKCTARVAEFPDLELCVDRPFFEQLPHQRVCNIICSSASDGGSHE